MHKCTNTQMHNCEKNFWHILKKEYYSKCKYFITNYKLWKNLQLMRNTLIKYQICQ